MLRYTSCCEDDTRFWTGSEVFGSVFGDEQGREESDLAGGDDFWEGHVLEFYGG
jgi:hypothetical protein